MIKAAKNTGKRIVWAFICCMHFACLTSAAASEPEVIQPDRPGYSWGTHTVAPGFVYIESGYQINLQRASTAFSNLPVVNLRFGIINNIEGFISWDGFSLSHTLNNGSNETTLPTVGFKAGIFDSEKFSVTLVGLTEFADEADKPFILPALAVAWDYSLSEKIDLFGLAGVFSITEQPELSFAAGLNTEISSGINLSLEYYNIYNTHSTTLLHGNEAGIIFNLNPNLQLDIFSGIRYDKNPEIYTGIGFAIRL
jgi:hypothetical protein